MQKTNAGVVVLGTGGTIAGVSQPGDDERHYLAAQQGIEQVLASVPDLPAGILLGCEQVAQIDSKDMGYAVWLRLVERLRHHLARAEVTGVVVTHGTDTLEETAYFLQRVLAPVKPVVLTAAMRPATAAEPDGPSNLRDAFAVACAGSASGVLATLAGRVFAGTDVRKVHPTRLDAFAAGEAGALGRVVAGRVQWDRLPQAGTAAANVVLPASAGEWPRVEVVYSHTGSDGVLVQALCNAGARGVVAVGTGNATLHQSLEEALRDAQAAGVRVLRSTRCPEGAATEKPGDAFPVARGLTPAQARIELQLQLMREP